MGGIRKYLYDHTRMVSMEDEEGGKTTFEYDSAGHIIKKHVVINNTEEAVTSYEYSPAGKLIRIVDAQDFLEHYLTAETFQLQVLILLH